ncbi:MAG: hypothetical protein P9M05_09260 [Candidatus Stygibacter australis]|nr:hypothetical protein [Candidatus Stygibacter australis]
MEIKVAKGKVSEIVENMTGKDSSIQNYDQRDIIKTIILTLAFTFLGYCPTDDQVKEINDKFDQHEITISEKSDHYLVNIPDNLLSRISKC